MPLDNFVPPLDPAPASSRDIRTRVNTSQFGDGYSQRSQDGLNAIAATYNAQWAALTDVDCNTIEAFFAAHTITPFLWQPPLETVTRKWIAAVWSRGYVGANVVALGATLSEVFDL